MKRLNFLGTLLLTAALSPLALAQVKIVNGPNVEQTTDSSAVIAWTTDAQSSAVVHYGTDQNKLDQTAQASWGGNANNNAATHRVTLKNLKPNTTYYFAVESGQAKGTGTSAKSDVKTFATTAKGAAANTTASTSSDGVVHDHVKLQAGPVVQNVTDKSATLWWMTTDDTRSVVKYGKDKNNLDQTAQAQPGTSHKVAINNLEPDTSYYFQVMSHDNLVRGAGAFHTEPAQTAENANKLRIINGPVIEYLTADSAVIAWSTNARASSVVRYGSDPNNLNQTATAPWGQETHRVTIKNLKPGTAYSFLVESSQAENTGTMAKSNPSTFNTTAQGAQAMRNQQ